MQHRWEAVLARRQHVARLTLEGLEQIEIARLVGCSQQQVSHDMKRNREAWQRSLLQDTDVIKTHELAKIDHLEREAWAAWHASKNPKETTSTEAAEGGEVIDLTTGKTRPTAPRRKATVRREGSCGDPRYLQAVMHCWERRAALLGLDAPTRVDLNLEQCTSDQLLALARGEPPERVLQRPLAQA